MGQTAPSIALCIAIDEIAMSKTVNTIAETTYDN